MTRTLMMVSLLGVAAGCSSKKTTPDAAPASRPLSGTVERGKYLVDTVLVCGECHTPAGPDGKPDPNMYLAGSRSYDFDTKHGIVSVYAENITSHATEGLGMWTNDEIRTVLTMGVDDEHVALWPIMPYPEY